MHIKIIPLSVLIQFMNCRIALLARIVNSKCVCLYRWKRKESRLFDSTLLQCSNDDNYRSRSSRYYDRNEHHKILWLHYCFFHFWYFCSWNTWVALWGKNRSWVHYLADTILGPSFSPSNGLVLAGVAVLALQFPSLPLFNLPIRPLHQLTSAL